MQRMNPNSFWQMTSAHPVYGDRFICSYVPYTQTFEGGSFPPTFCLGECEYNPEVEQRDIFVHFCNSLGDTNRDETLRSLNSIPDFLEENSGFRSPSTTKPLHLKSYGCEKMSKNMERDTFLETRMISSFWSLLHSNCLLHVRVNDFLTSLLQKGFHTCRLSDPARVNWINWHVVANKGLRVTCVCQEQKVNCFLIKLCCTVKFMKGFGFGHPWSEEVQASRFI